MAATVYEREISRRRHMWAEFVLGSLPYSEIFFFLGTLVFPFPQTSTLPDSNSFWNERTRLKEGAGSYPLAIYVFL